MNKHLLLLISIVFAVSCSTIKSGEKICYKNLKTIQSISWSEGLLVNSHLKLKKGNYFDYYQAAQVFIDSKIEKTESLFKNRNLNHQVTKYIKMHKEKYIETS